MAGLSSDEIAFCRAVPAVRAAQRDAARTALREVEVVRGGVVLPEHLAVPVLVLVGELTDSPLYLDGLDALVEALGAQRVALPGRRHIAMAADAACFAEALRRHLRRG